MESQIEQSASASLPYEVYEIKAKAVIGGTVLPVSYIGISSAGNTHRAVADHKSLETTSNIVLWHCLQSGSNYSIYPRGEVSSRQSAADLVRSLIAERTLVLNEYGTAWAGNSVYRQYLTEYGLEQMEHTSRVQRCLSCGDTKDLSEFSLLENKPRTDCRECLKEQRKSGLRLAKYRQFRLNGWVLPSPRSAAKAKKKQAASKKCYCCGIVKKGREFWPHPTISDGLQSSCKACFKEKDKLGISMKDLKERKGNI